MGELNLDKIERTYLSTDDTYKGDRVSSLSAWKMLTRNDEIPYKNESAGAPEDTKDLLTAR